MKQKIYLKNYINIKKIKKKNKKSSSKIFEELIKEINQDLNKPDNNIYVLLFHAVVEACTVTNIDPEDVKKFISPVIKEKIEAEAMRLNFLPRQNTLYFE